MKKYSIIAAGLIGIASFAAAFAASAQVSATAAANVSAGRVASTTVRARIEARYGTSTPGMREGSTTRMTAAERMTALQGRSDTEISNRIDSLNKILARINAMVKVSVSDKASLATSLQTEISDLTTLKATIDADTSTTSLKTDAQSITKAYRIYALILPQASIMAAADRVLDIVSEFNTVAAKIQTYVTTAQSNGTDVSAAVSALADLSAKTADATAQADVAISEVASLQPDQGVAATMQANTAALKDAQSKIKAATADLVTARKDAGTAVDVIKGSMNVSGKASASTTTR